MVAANFILDNNSPLIQYNEDFLITPGDDSLAAWYYLGTYTVTDVNAAYLTWTFTGTQFTIWGVRSANHGTYTYTIDDGPQQSMNGNSPDLLYQQALVQGSNLPQGSHTVVLTNTGSGNTSALDVDMITFKSDIASSEPLVSSIIQDTDAGFTYSSGWNTSPLNVSLFNNASGHSTTGNNEYVTLSFTGVAVSLYGAVGPTKGQYSVVLDGADPHFYNGTSWYLYTQVMLFHANDIGEGPHELTVYNTPSGAQNTLAIDYAEILSYANSTVAPQTSQASLSSLSQKGLIGGLAAASTVALLSIISTLYLLRTVRRLKNYQRLTSLATHDLDNLAGPYFRSNSFSSAPGAYIPASAAVTAANSGMEQPSAGSHDATADILQAADAPDPMRRAVPEPCTEASTNERAPSVDAPPSYR